MFIYSLNALLLTIASQQRKLEKCSWLDHDTRCHWNNI